MRIAIVSLADFPFGMGPARRTMMMGIGLAECGNDVYLVGPRFTGYVAPEVMSGIKILWSGVHRPDERRTFASVVWERLRLFKEMNRLTSEGLDWLIFYNLGLDALSLYSLARRRDVKVANENCDLRNRGDLRNLSIALRGLSYSIFERLIRPRSDLNIVVSTLLEHEIRRVAPNRPILRIPAIIDTVLFAADEIAARRSRELWALGDAQVVAYLGGSQKFEGLRTFLVAAQILRQTGLEFKVLIASQNVISDHHEDLPNLLRELNLERDVVLTGRLETEEVLGAMSAADVLVLPKTSHAANRAGFPQKLAEYMSMGKAVVSTNVGDISLYIESGCNGLLCEAEDPRAMAYAIRGLLSNATLRNTLGDNARVTAQRLFDARCVGRILSNALTGAQTGDGAGR